MSAKVSCTVLKTSRAGDRPAEFDGVELTEHIQFEIDAMKVVAAELGLERGAATPDEESTPAQS